MMKSIWELLPTAEVTSGKMGKIFALPLTWLLEPHTVVFRSGTFTCWSWRGGYGEDLESLALKQAADMTDGAFRSLPLQLEG